jgi:hypothetical protein
MSKSIAQLTDRLFTLSSTIADAQTEFHRVKEQIRTMREGRHDFESGTVTVYKVKEHKVRSHVRHAYRAIRVTAGHSRR